MVLGNITPCRPLSTMITQKLIYTCRWLGSHMGVDGFNSDGVLPHLQLCWSHYRWRVRLQDWLHSGDEFSIAFKVNSISEDLLPVTVTSRLSSSDSCRVQESRPMGIKNGYRPLNCVHIHFHSKWILR